MQKLDKTAYNFLYLIMIVAVVMVLLRFIAPFKWAIMVAVIFTGFALGGFLLLKFLKEIRAENKYRNSLQGNINEQLKYCQKQIIIIKKEIDDIGENMVDLKEKLTNPISLHESVKLETHKMMMAFQKEKEIRITKLDFFYTAIEKLKIIGHNQDVSITLQKKKDKLQKLQENQFEALSDLEEIKTNLELQKDYVQAIDRMSLKMLELNRLEDASILKMELEAMTKELSEL